MAGLSAWLAGVSSWLPCRSPPPFRNLPWASWLAGWLVCSCSGYVHIHKAGPCWQAGFLVRHQAQRGPERPSVDMYYRTSLSCAWLAGWLERPREAQRGPASQPASQPISQPASHATSQPASQPAARPLTGLFYPRLMPASQPPSQPASQSASQPFKKCPESSQSASQQMHWIYCSQTASQPVKKHLESTQSASQPASQIMTQI